MICNKRCCTAKCCPLVPAWATTIHKFQGFEAGFDKSDLFERLICDPGDVKWEQLCPGALYTAISRAKTMGTHSDSELHPRDSAIYWKGAGMSETRILQGSLKNGKRKGDPKENCILINKRERWVNYLLHQRQKTRHEEYTDSTIKELKAKCFSQHNVRDGIAQIITNPNETWLELKRNRYTLDKTYFGNCT